MAIICAVMRICVLFKLKIHHTRKIYIKLNTRKEQYSSTQIEALTVCYTFHFVRQVRNALLQANQNAEETYGKIEK